MKLTNTIAANSPSGSDLHGDYLISGGSNGYSAGAGYNLVTGLGTPVANLLVSDLVAYQGPSTSYSGPTVGPLQNASLNGDWTGSGGPTNVFSVFDSLTVTNFGLNHARAKGTSRQQSAVGHGTSPARLAQRPFTNLQAGAVRVIRSVAVDGLAQPSTRPATALNSAVDQVLGAVLDANSRDALDW